MTYYTNPIPEGTDRKTITDKDAIEYMYILRTDRRNKGTAIPRFVRAITKAGYPVTVSSYKECESHRGKSIEHIRNGMLDKAYDVLNAIRVQDSPQPPNTARAMTVIAHARQSQGLEYFHMAEKLEKRGVPITEAEYRTAEQGINKHVTYEVVAESARILGVSAGELFS